MTPEQAARDHLNALAPLWIKQEHAAPIVSGGVQPLRGGSSIVTLRQQIDNVDVHQGEMRVMLYPNGDLSSISGTLLATPRSPKRAPFRRTARDAVNGALDDVYGPARERPAVRETESKGGYQHVAVAATSAFHVQQSRAKPEWFRQDEELVAAWSVEVIADKAGKIDAWRYILSDEDGHTLRKVNLVQADAFVYRAFADRSGKRRPLDGPLMSFAPHPTGTPDGSLPALASSNLVVVDSLDAAGDPWLPTEATHSAGNNVDAVADITPSGPGTQDTHAKVRAGRILNYTYDFTKEPGETASQSQASVTNLFFLTNWLHDWYYDSGFTEVTGNAQADNLGRGGVGGDRLIAHAQAQSGEGSRDNAFMVTPLDGLSPSMFMFQWSTTVEATVGWTKGRAQAGYLTLGPRNFDVEGNLAVGDDGTETASDGCEPFLNDLKGKIVLIDGGGCSERVPLENAAKAGALAVIFSMGDLQPLVGATGAVPALSLSAADGAALKTALATGPLHVSLHRSSSGPERDGALDNTIVAHEWGHYLHNRLASCEAAQCAAMSEGWGDFVALQMILREEDDRNGSYGTGVYALSGGALTPYGFEDPGYFGIRRYPYSIDHGKNPLSFRHIGDDAPLPVGPPVNAGPLRSPNSEPHNAGEIWATMLWEAYQALIDAHGLETSRRRMTDYVVAGLLLTPPNATFTEGRDALLAAAGGLDSDDMVLMAAAFAGRGAGTCAVGPAPDSTNFAFVVESGTLAGKLEASTPTLRVDGVSCDNDAYLDPGESGTLRLTLVNGGVVAVEGVVVTATTTMPGVTLGKPLHIPSLAPFATANVEIPVAAAASMPVDKILKIAVEIGGDAGCKTQSVLVELEQRVGLDDIPDASKNDDVEANITPWKPTGLDVGSRWARVGAPAGNHSWLGSEATLATDTQLTSPVLHASTTEPLVIGFAHRFDFKTRIYPGPPDGTSVFAFIDGGLIEISANDGATWTDAALLGANTGYTGMLETSDNPIAGKKAYAGTNPAFPQRDQVVLDFGDQFAGKAVRIRFRIGTDSSDDAASPGTGWDIDDIRVRGIDNTPFSTTAAQKAGSCGAR